MSAGFGIIPLIIPFTGLKKGKLQNTTVILNNNVVSPVETLLSKKGL